MKKFIEILIGCSRKILPLGSIVPKIVNVFIITQLEIQIYLHGITSNNCEFSSITLFDFDKLFAQNFILYKTEMKMN